MDILLGTQAKETLKRKIIPDNCSGIIFENGMFSWWYNSGTLFDSGERPSFFECFQIIKNLTSREK